LAKRHVDKEKIERANREARRILEAERRDRNAKTARLRELRINKGREQAGTQVGD